MLIEMLMCTLSLISFNIVPYFEIYRINIKYRYDNLVVRQSAVMFSSADF